MALTSDDLMRLELKARLHADRLRKEWPDDPTEAPEVKAYAASMRADAKSFDAIGDLLLGLQGDWPSLAPLVRRGYQHMAAAYEKAKARDAAEAKPATDEAAA